MIRIINPGIFTSIQDRGRPGYRKIGVPLGGEMSRVHAAMANKLLGKEAGDPVFEFASPGPEFYFEAAAEVAICGAEMKPILNGRPAPMNQVLMVPEGSTLKFGRSDSMFWGYMAVSDTLDVPEILGSRGFTPGITPKARFEAGDEVNLIASGKKAVAGSPQQADRFDAGPEHLEVFKGPEYKKLEKPFRELLVSEAFKLSTECNRMAYILKHDTGMRADEIITAPVQPGTVQLTSSGRLIVLMRDAQTTGGYGRILQLSEEAIDLLAQKRPGEPVRFRLLD